MKAFESTLLIIINAQNEKKTKTMNQDDRDTYVEHQDI